MVIIASDIELEVGKPTIAPACNDSKGVTHYNVGALVIRTATEQEWLDGIEDVEQRAITRMFFSGSFKYFYAILMD